MFLATHNTMSYLPPKQWYLRPFAFLARCQNISYQEQYESGARGFDLRLYWDEDGTLIFKHGFFKYSGSEISDVLDFANSHYMAVRVLLEIRGKYISNNPKTYSKHMFQSGMFYNFCEKIEAQYPNIKFYGGKTTGDWSLIYNFCNEIKQIDMYSSTTSFFKSDNYFLRIIDDWWPWLYAILHNKSNIKKCINNGNTDGYLMIDFIDIQ